MRYRRLLVLAISCALLVAPAINASAAECPSITGSAMFDFGRNVGWANVNYGGQQARVPFYAIGFDDTGEGTADIYFVWEFPEGDIVLVEHSAGSVIAGPAVNFNSTIDVLEGGSGHWTWSGTSNLAAFRAAIGQISGDLCVDV